MSELKEAAKVPSFTVMDHNSKEVSNEVLLGNKYILFFYGQDDTPTCNKQVCSANDALSIATQYGYKLFGVSPDKPAKHLKFIDKYQLKVELLSDPDKSMMYAFGAYGPKIFMGKEVTGVYRKAVLVDEKGKIQKILSDVVAAQQGDLLIEALKTLHTPN